MQRVHVGLRNVFRPSYARQVGVFWSNRWIVKPSRHALRGLDLTLRILQHVGHHSMKDSFSAGDERCSMLPRRHIVSTGFDTVQVHVRVIEECVEYADRVASPANTSNHTPGQLTFLLQDLSTGLSAVHALEVADHGRVGVWAHYGP